MRLFFYYHKLKSKLNLVLCDRWGPHYEGQWVVHETKTVDSDPDEAVASEEGSPAKEKGAKGDKGGGQPKFSWQLIMVRGVHTRVFSGFISKWVVTFG